MLFIGHNICAGIYAEWSIAVHNEIKYVSVMLNLFQHLAMREGIMDPETSSG
jgi:hypothetical protein